METILVAFIAALPPTLAAVAALLRVRHATDTQNGATLGQTVHAIDVRQAETEAKLEDFVRMVEPFMATLLRHLEQHNRSE